ncbi:prosaposin [Carassius gibelio]|uniref:prosaposin n=1 Tax=Carassius gibelio TaxID=101364 RepID=UPI00227900E3|nr:prosaposin [Carassius gibelio]
MTKSLVFLLASLVFCSDVQMGTSQYFEHPNPVREMEFSYHDKATENKQIIYCSVCKAIVRKLISYIGKNANKEEVNRKLDNICTKIKIPGCSGFLRKYKNKLVTALLSGDKAATICVKLKLCKRYT